MIIYQYFRAVSSKKTNEQTLEKWYLAWMTFLSRQSKVHKASKVN